MVKVPYLSASRLKMAKDCPWQYQQKYDPPSDDAIALKWKGEHRDNAQAAKVGTNIHNALEEWRRPGGPRPTGKRLRDLYEAENAKNEVDFDFYMDGKNMLKRWFDRRGKQPISVVEVEMAFGSHRAPYVLQNGTPVFGFIDLVIEHEDGTIELIDYKTQRAPMTQAEANSNVQAGIYLTVAREVWPDRPLRFSFDLTRYGVVTVVWDDERIADFANWLKAQYEWIKTMTDPKPSIGPGCQWCVYTEICPKAQELMQKGAWDLIAPSVEDVDLNEMLDELATIKASQAMLTKRKKSIDNFIKDEVFGRDKHPDECVEETDGWSVEWRESSSVTYIPSEVQQLVPPAVFGTMASISKSAVDRVLPVLPENVADAVKRSAIIKPSRRLIIKPKGRSDNDDGVKG